MKKYIIIIVIAAVSATSCTTSQSMYKNENEVAGYTLKSKKELMQQKIAKKKSKTVLATP